MDRKIYHTNDLAVLWKISNRHTLYMTISRSIARGILYPIYKGLYATVPVETLDPLILGIAIIHRYTYLTTETVLSNAGVISQAVFYYTFAADVSKHVVVGPWSFRYRQLKNEYLFHPAGIGEQNGLQMASVERAAADMLYFNPNYHFDVPDLIDQNKLQTIKNEIGY
ncbi:MAG: hypothetical protein WA109_02775 [Bellilinea sp.]